MYIWRKLHLRYILFYVLAVIRSYVWNISHVLRLSQLKDSRLISVPGCTNYCWVSRRTCLLPGQVWCRQLQFMSQAHLCFADQCQSPSIQYPLRLEPIPWASHSPLPAPSNQLPMEYRTDELPPVKSVHGESFQFNSGFTHRCIKRYFCICIHQLDTAVCLVSPASVYAV